MSTIGSSCMDRHCGCCQTCIGSAIGHDAQHNSHLCLSPSPLLLDHSPHPSTLAIGAGHMKPRMEFVAEQRPGTCARHVSLARYALDDKAACRQLFRVPLTVSYGHPYGVCQQK